MSGSGINNSGGGGASASGWVKIEAQTASSTSSLTFTTGIDSTYDVYMFVLSDVIAATDSNALRLKMSNDGGSTYEEAASDYAYSSLFMNEGADSDGGSSGATDIRLVSGNVGSDIGESLSGTVFLFAPSNSSTFTKIRSDIALDSNLGNVSYVAVAGRRETAEANDAIKFDFLSGNIESGTITLYGLTK